MSLKNMQISLIYKLLYAICYFILFIFFNYDLINNFDRFYNPPFKVDF